MMMRLLLAVALAITLSALFCEAGIHGHHGGHIGGHGHGHHGWGPKYHGWAQVSHWQNPWAYQYGLKEQGKGWAKQVWVGQEFKGWHHG